MDGSSPEGALLMGGGGGLYGTTYSGGKGVGTVFRMAAVAGSTGWAHHVILNFGAGGQDDEAYPTSGVIMDKHGILYGATMSGRSILEGLRSQCWSCFTKEDGS